MEEYARKPGETAEVWHGRVLGEWNARDKKLGEASASREELAQPVKDAKAALSAEGNDKETDRGSEVPARSD